jgi:hypothetical protein
MARALHRGAVRARVATPWHTLTHALAAVLAATILLLSLPMRAEDASGVLAATRCPLRFDANTIGLPRTCMFVGRYNSSCGQQAVAVFAGDGQAMVVGVALGQTSPVVYLPAQALSGTNGIIVRWRPDLHLDTAAPEGSVSLEDEGQTLRVRMPVPAIDVDGCAFSEFVGHFVDMIGAAPPPRPLGDLVSRQQGL